MRMHVRESGVGVGGNRERNNIIYERQTDRGKGQIFLITLVITLAKILITLHFNMIVKEPHLLGNWANKAKMQSVYGKLNLKIVWNNLQRPSAVYTTINADLLSFVSCSFFSLYSTSSLTFALCSTYHFALLLTLLNLMLLAGNQMGNNSFFWT